MNLAFQVIGIVIFLCCNKVSGDAGIEKVEHDILKNLLADYDPSVRPSGKYGTGPVEVETNIYVRNIRDFDESKMLYSTQLTLRLHWRDDRLKYDEVKNLSYISVVKEGILWQPDLFFSNEIEAHSHDILQPNLLLRIYPNGEVLYSKRISLRLLCAMDLQNFPFDNQVCNIVFASYGYTTQHQEFFWKSVSPIQVTKNEYQRKFKLVSFLTDYCTSKTNTGTYSCLKLDFYFSRNSKSFLRDVYLPTTFLVILSCLVFWLNPKNSTIRFGIWISTLILMFMLVLSLSFKIPQTPYTKAIDTWTGSCFTFLLIVGIELCFVKRAVDNAESLAEEERECSKEERNSMKLEDPNIHRKLRGYLSIPLRWYRHSSQVQKVDVVFRVVYPLTFAIFAGIYFLVYSGNKTFCYNGSCDTLK